MYFTAHPEIRLSANQEKQYNNPYSVLLIIDISMLNIALFGPPGAGKGTQSEFLINKYKLFYISTGDLLRKEIANKTKLGQEAVSLMSAGQLVSDEIIVQIIENTITQNPQANGFLFDGFPRTYVQAYILQGLMIKLHTSLNLLISIHVPEELSVQRLLKRGESSGRLDDNDTVIRKRLVEYHEKTLPVLDFYRNQGIFHEVDGTKEVANVTSQISQLIDDELSKRLYNILLFGYPGSGRGQHGRALAQRFGLEYITTGKILETEIMRGSKIGKRVQAAYEQGQLVPDEVVVQIIEEKLENSKDVKGFIFKGFPRTLVQSYILDGLLQKHDTNISQILELEVPPLDLIIRLDERGKSGPYDNSTANIVKRLKEHELKTSPVIEKYRQNFDIVKINGLGPFEEVFERVAAEVEMGIKNKR
ncbi:MAG: adenylate kinase [Ignavibacteria bacterium]|nr:adenylate kinase [Ignavibacteria bacterium]